jgi:hypothetical protein
MIALQPALKFNGGGECMPFLLSIADNFLCHADMCGLTALMCLCRPCESQHILAEPHASRCASPCLDNPPGRMRVDCTNYHTHLFMQESPELTMHTLLWVKRRPHDMHAVVGFITPGRQFERQVCAVQKYEPPSGALAQQIEKDFGSLDKLVADFNPKTAAIQVRSRMS